MSREIKLNGGEITILKTLGLTGTPVHGKQLLERAEEMESAELLDTLTGLIALGYVVSTKVNVRRLEDLDGASFRVNPAFARDLKDALHPGRNRDHEQRGRRQRRG